MARRSRAGVTGERRDTETVMRRSERGGWKSADTVTRWPPTLLFVRCGERWRETYRSRGGKALSFDSNVKFQRE